MARIELLKTFGTLIFPLHWVPVMAAVLDLVSGHRVRPGDARSDLPHTAVAAMG